MQRDRTTTYKIVSYTIFLIVLYLLETATPLGGLKLFGARLDLLFSVPAAVALMENPAVGAAIGLTTGILYDLAGTGVEGLLPLYFMLFATFAGAISGRYLRRIWPSHLLLTAGGMLILRGFQFVLSAMVRVSYPILPFLQSMYGEILAAIVLSPFIYLPVRTMARRFDRMK